MSKEFSPLDEQLERLRIESDILRIDKHGRFDNPTEVLRRSKIERVNRQTVLCLDTEGFEEAFDGYEYFESGGVGKRLNQLKRNP